jgi:DNA-3-methyladenine glycosylase
LSIDRELDRSIVALSSGLWIESDNCEVPEVEVERTPRIGIGYAGREWVDKPYRLVWKTEQFA